MKDERRRTDNLVQLRAWRHQSEAPRHLPASRRLSYLLGGSLIVCVGLPLSVLLAIGFWDRRHTQDIQLSWVLGIALGLAVTSFMTLFGIDLMMRGISGREWSSRFWLWADARVMPLLLRFRPRTTPAVAWFVIAALLVGFAFSNRQDPREWDPAFLWFGGFLQILLHELGHLATALGVGYVPTHLSAGPLALGFTKGRPIPALNRSWSTFLYGQVIFLRPHPARAKDIAVAASGPLANLLVLVGFIILLPPTSGPFMDLFLRNNGIIAGVIVCGNLLPLPRTSDGFATDGRQILDLLRQRPSGP